MLIIHDYLLDNGINKQTPNEVHVYYLFDQNNTMHFQAMLFVK